MITIRVSDKEVEINGHSDTDICRSVSTVAFAIANTLDEMQKNKQCRYFCRFSKGYMHLKAYATKGNEKTLQGVLLTAKVGLQTIARDYPKKVKMHTS